MAPAGIRSNKKGPKKAVIAKEKAAQIIQNQWHIYKNVRQFRLLRTVLHKTERMLTKNVLRLLEPNEAKYLQDYGQKVKEILSRLAGGVFPPKIVYKIFTTGYSVQYYNGHDLIQPGSKVDEELTIQAAKDSLLTMGKCRFQKNILAEDMKKESSKISKAYEVTDKMEFIQFMSTLDKKPAHLGGRCNDWRELALSSDLLLILEYFAKDEWLDYDCNLIPDKVIPHIQKGPTKYKIATKFSKSKNKAHHLNIEDLGKDFEMLFDWASSLDESEFLTDLYQI